MIKKKGIELNQAFGAILVVVLLALLVIISIVMFQSMSNSFNTETSSSSQIILAESSDTLTPIGRGITSYEVKANNRTWINCTTSDSLVVEITENKATVSVWFANATSDWTSLIKAGSDIYIDGTLDAGWTWLPYFVSGDIITFCKSDGSTFLDVSVDEIRVYEKELNSTEVTTVFNDGR